MTQPMSEVMMKKMVVSSIYAFDRYTYTVVCLYYQMLV